MSGGGKGGGGGSTVTQTQKAEPWSGVQPYITDYLQKGQSATSQPFSFYNGSQIAGFSPEQQLGMQMTTNRAMAGSPLLNSAQTNATNTLNGDYMSPDSNPWLKQNVNTALNDVTGRVNSQFANNNFGGSTNQEMLTRNLGDTAASMYGANYANERQNQMNLIPQSVGLSQADYADPTALMGVGAQRQNLANQYLGNATNTYNQAADWPYQQLQRYGNVVAQGMGTGGTTTSTGQNPNQQNGWANALGTGLTAYGLYSGLGGLGALGGMSNVSPGISLAGYGAGLLGF